MTGKLIDKMYTMAGKNVARRRMGLFALVIVLITACSTVSESDQASAASDLPQAEAEASGGKWCGDGTCDGPENTANCLEDCGKEDATEDEQPRIPVEVPGIYWVKNPTSGVDLYVEILTPDNWDGNPLPTLVLIPGGSGDSSHFTESPQNTARLLDAGYALIVFDPDGRGNSSGEEDNNGFTHQDGLAAIVTYAADLPQVDEARIGLVSYSYGITMASGALARHPEMPIRFLIDWEGPATRDDTGGCDADKLGHLTGYACDDEEFWREREAAGFALKIEVPYLRLQTEIDHVQPDNNHALLMINNATSEAYGGHGRAPWTRLNDLPINQVYDLNDPPQLIPEDRSVNTDAMIIRGAEELFGM